jgi:hypothetical protein
MNFKDIEEIKNAGFNGFKKISELILDNSCLPKIKGVYVVLNVGNKAPEFLSKGTGGYFKGKNPNVSIEELKRNWVDKAIVVYIGKAGTEEGKSTLKSRLSQYLRFGQGKNIGHYGGRLIWQLKHSGDLVVCWKTLSKEDPRTLEANLIRQFVSKYSNRPFANLKD